MKKFILGFSLLAFLLGTLPACKAKHCAAMDPTMEGYNKKTGKKKKGRQEGLFDKNMNRR